MAHDQILGVENAQNVVSVALNDRDAGVLCLQQYLADLLIGVLQVEPLDLRPGCHGGIHSTAFVESQHALQHVLFGLFENAQFCALVNEHLDLLGGHVRDGQMV